ncbi:MAG: DUF3995 domain-containing protein [Acidobacteria bacterium]|nr:DUF3995 domain-containing protein [Acidobacteriota bacterium]
MNEIARVFAAGGGGLVLLGLSGLHVYWVCGGRWGADAAVPTAGTRPLFRPSRAGTSVVGVLLAGAGAVVLAEVSPWAGEFTKWGTRALGAVFALRALGEFKWVGFFKRVRGTKFAKLDTWLYSPLCAVMAAACLYLGWR